MRKTIIALALALTSTAAFAVHTCDTMSSKKDRINCWSNFIGSNMQEADEYLFAVQESRKVPAPVKQKVEAKRKAITSDADRQCKKDDLGYPENSCYIEQIQNFKDFTYKETSKYGVPDMRLN